MPHTFPVEFLLPFPTASSRRDHEGTEFTTSSRSRLKKGLWHYMRHVAAKSTANLGVKVMNFGAARTFPDRIFHDCRSINIYISG